GTGRELHSRAQRIIVCSLRHWFGRPDLISQSFTTQPRAVGFENVLTAEALRTFVPSSPAWRPRRSRVSLGDAADRHRERGPALRVRPPG
ncbi:MAG: hypothetical protein U0793_03215, partial [Gemmataceae bacterium]